MMSQFWPSPHLAFPRKSSARALKISLTSEYSALVRRPADYPPTALGPILSLISFCGEFIGTDHG